MADPRQRRRKKKGVSLHRCFSLVSFAFLPFAVFFTESWWQLGVVENGYRANALKIEIQEQDARIQQLRVQAAALETKDNLAPKGFELGLVKPAPNQIEHIAAGRPSQQGEILTFAEVTASPFDDTTHAIVQPPGSNLPRNDAALE